MTQEDVALKVSMLLAQLRSGVLIWPYVPAYRKAPARKLDVVSAWSGIEEILAEMIERFGLKTERCLEFGVEHGFSTVALSSYFESVTGVDTFMGDIHTKIDDDIYDAALALVAPYGNIHLVRSDYRDFILRDSGFYDLIHVDIVHTYEDTLACGLWSAQHSKCTIFHDTQSYPDVKRAVIKIAGDTGKKFYNYKESFGLGIVA
jgi:hypothetical protein